MLSEEQRIEKLRKLSFILKVLPDCKSIGEISEKTNIPTSTIQRYLNDKKMFMELFIQDIKVLQKIEEAEQTYGKVQEFLRKSKEEGLSKGGKKSQELYGYEKDEYGKFRGSKK